jgi:hypothetical protein
MVNVGSWIEWDGDQSYLICPGCGDPNLHQVKVEVFNRDREDSKTGLHVEIVGQTISLDEDIKNSPSGRRDGLYIYFGCEECPEIVRLSIYQHKGTTYMDIVQDDSETGEVQP